MISAQNHPQRLSGNKYWALLGIGLLFSACSPKIKPNTAKKTDSPEKVKEVEKPVAKFTEADVALLVPFRLNEMKVAAATKAEVERSAMAIDFYQGFKLGIDSAAKSGMNFKLKVFDTRDNNNRLESLINNGALTGSDLIVGPVFPQGVKYMTAYSIARNIPMVSPLAATHPEEFANPNLISIVNNIELHAEKIGDYVSKTYRPENTVVVLINPKTSSDEILAAPLRQYFHYSKKSFVFQEYTSVFSLEPRMARNKHYVVLVASSDKKFVVPTLDKLMKIKSKGFNLSLFGHPDWAKQNYNTDKLQTLNTVITSSYQVDYRSASTVNFVRKYRAAFNFEPGEYAFKGFDIGLYFGKLFAEHGAGYLKYLTKEKYKGLHNNFDFIYKEKQGYINTSLMLLRYRNYALNVIE